MPATFSIKCTTFCIAGPDPISLFGIDKSVAQAKQLLAENPPPPGN